MWTMEKTASAESPRRSASVAELISNLTEQQVCLMETYKTFLDSMRLESNLHETEERLSNLRKAGSKLISLQKEHMIKMLLMLYPIFRVVMSQSQFEEDACIQMLSDKTRLQSYDLVELSCILRCYFAKLAVYVYHLASFVKDRTTYESMIPKDPNLKLQQDVTSHMNMSDDVFHTPTSGSIPQNQVVYKTYNMKQSVDNTSTGTSDPRSHRQPSTPSNISYETAGAVCHKNVASMNHSTPLQYDALTTSQRYKQFESDDGSTEQHSITMRNGQPHLLSYGEGISIRSKSSSSSRYKGMDVDMFRDHNAYYDLRSKGKGESDNIVGYLETNDIYSSQKVKMDSTTVEDTQTILGNTQQAQGYGMPQPGERSKEPDVSAWYTTGGSHGMEFAADNCHPLRNNISVSAGVNMPHAQCVQDNNAENMVGTLQHDCHTKTIMQAARSVYPVEHLTMNGSKNRNVSMSYRCDTPGNRSVQSDVSDLLVLDCKETERPYQSNMWAGIRNVKSPVKNLDVPYNGRKQSSYFAGMCCGGDYDDVSRTRYVQKGSPRFVPDSYHPSFYLKKQQICRQVHVKGSDDNGMQMTYLFYDTPINDDQMECSKRSDEEEVVNHAKNLPSSTHTTVADNDDMTHVDLKTQTASSGDNYPQQADVSPHVEGSDVGKYHVAQRNENYQDLLGSEEYAETVTEYMLEDPDVSSIISKANKDTGEQSSFMEDTPVNAVESSQHLTSVGLNDGHDISEKEDQVAVLHRPIGGVEEHLCLQVQLSQEDVLADQIVESSDRECFNGGSDVIDCSENGQPTVDDRHIHNSSVTKTYLVTANKGDFTPTENMQVAISSWKLSEGDGNAALLNQQQSDVATQYSLAERFMGDATPDGIAKTTNTTCVTESVPKAMTCEMPCSSPQNSEDDILSSSRIRIPLIDMSKLVIHPNS